MCAENMQYKLIGEEWRSVDSIIMFGYGRQGKKAVETLKRDFNIIMVLENDQKKWGENTGFIVGGIEQARKVIHQYKIIVTVSERYYSEIRKQLEILGLQEYRDFAMYEDFIMEWYYRFREEIYIVKTDIPITSYCSLNCENCHLHIPYWKKKEHFDTDKIITTVNDYFAAVDYVVDMDVLGGEPLLHPQIDKVLYHIAKNYRNRIGYLGVITNGTIIPQESTLQLMKDYEISISISDYSQIIGEKSKVDELCELLDKFKVIYYRNKDIVWLDFGMPDGNIRYDGENARIHFQKCDTIYHIVYDRKFFLCGTAWAAEYCGYINDKKFGEIALYNDRAENIRTRIYEYCNGKVENGYLPYCKVCGGFGADNMSIVPSAIQMR